MRWTSKATEVIRASAYDDGILNPSITGASSLQEIIEKILSVASTDWNPESWGKQWTISPYTPTPTIIEAARTLYENHSVEDITRHEADKVSTDATIDYLLQVIRTSKERGEKSICFVTGVPGAGKTLVGLDVAIKQSYKDGEKDKENGAVYLSGNGPLVAVLTEALAIDNQKKCKDQIIHRYRDNMLTKIKNPVENGVLEIDPTKAVEMEHAGYGEVEHVAIFDEAQRTWTHERLANYLKRGGTYGNKLKVPNFPVSEAAFLIWSLDQRKDWAVIICLVGGGQEINTGEAGIAEWIDALNNHYPYWKVYISNKLTDAEYAEGKVNQLLRNNPNVVYSDSLHLAVSLRSFRAETLSSFVHACLNFSPSAIPLYRDVSRKGYPVVLTRDINKARTWLRQMARGSQQTGILVTKVAARFKPQAVNVLAQGDENAVHWFLEDKTDIRSSNYLEEAATEIQVQGLELDYACVLWDADMRCENGKWAYYKFNGKNKWNPEKNEEQRKYMLNAYRVLLTRARQGIVICVPEGNSRLNSEGFPEDATRLPKFYDGTYEYLKSWGITSIDNVNDMYYPCLALGGLYNGISPFEMTQAYNAISNNGNFKRVSTISYIMIEDKKIEVNRNEHQVISTEAAGKLKESLNGVSRYGTGRTAVIDGHTTYLKTGTTNDVKDLWTCGFTDEVTMCLWGGYDTPKYIPLWNVNAVWKASMDSYYKR